MRHASEIVQSQIANGLSIAGQQPHLKNFSFSLREVRGNVKRRGLRSCSIAPKKPSVPLDRWVLKKERKKQLLFDGERERELAFTCSHKSFSMHDNSFRFSLHPPIRGSGPIRAYSLC